MSQALNYVMQFYNITEKIPSVSGPFIKWSSCKTIKREMRLPESCLNPWAYVLRHELNLEQHANLDSCYSRFGVSPEKTYYMVLTSFE